MKTHIKSLDSLRLFAKEFVSTRPNGSCVGLEGELGAGKTTFVRLCIEEICSRAEQSVPRVTSPSFVIHQVYPLVPSVDHFDLYRMDVISEEQLAEIGYFEALERVEKGGFLFVEWPSRAKDPKELQLKEMLSIEFLSQGRELTLTNN